MKKIILLTALFFSCFKLSYSQPGNLDSSFGTNGFITIKDSSGVAMQALVQTDGSSYVIINKNFLQTYISKRKYDGSVDISYGNNGFAALVDVGFSKAIFQNDGKIIVVGQNNYNFALARYNTDGTLDKSFSEDGMQVTDFGSRATSAAIQKDGKIVVAGEAETKYGTPVFALARYNTNGSLDSSFFKDGTKTTEFNAENTGLFATSVAIQSDGKIVVGGTKRYDARYGTYYNVFLARYNTDGNRDLSFGDNEGFAEVGGYGSANAIAIQPDDKIVVAGQVLYEEESEDGGYTYTSDFKLARLNADGRGDTTSSPYGSFTTDTDFGYDDERATSLAIQSDGKMVVGGYVDILNANYPNDKYVFGLARYNTDGSLDKTFSEDGKQITDLKVESAIIWNVAIADNRLYAAGDGIVARYFLDNETKAPIVTLSIPHNIIKHSAPARIKLNAAITNKPDKITKVQFYNGTTLLHTEDVSPYGFLWIDVPAGNYTLTAKAFDNSGNVITSNAINVSVVNENVSPVVSIVSPVDDTTYTGPATIRLIAQAKDPNDKISKVEFYNGTALLRTEYIYPYTYTWTNVQPGTYEITAKAYDDKSLSATSDPVTVRVTNAAIVSRPSSANNKTDLNGALSLRLSPNPTSNTLQIFTKGLQLNKPATISVISASGVVMKTIQSNASDKVVQLDVSSMVSGVYAIKVVSGDKVMYKQFVKL